VNLPLQKTAANRFYELDALRGFSVILMVVYHFLFDLDYFNIRPMPGWLWPQQLYGFPITFLFIFIAGISLALSASKTRNSKMLTQKMMKRGIFIFAIGLLITTATWIYPHDGAILFGVLHLIGMSTILAIPFLIGGTKDKMIENEAHISGKQKTKNLLLIWIPLTVGIIVIAFSKVVEKISGPIWMVPLGIHPYGFYALDYEPLFPWFGVVLIGIAVGFWIYPKGERRFSLNQIEPKWLKGLSWIGRHSLEIYLVHQPVILGLLLLAKIIL
jgi:Predicted membrane protein